MGAEIANIIFSLVLTLGPIYLLVHIYVSLRRSSARREIFTLHLRALARLQLPLHEGLANSNGTPREIARLMRKTSEELEQGAPLAAILAGRWACIPSWYARVVGIGERHGNLAEVLDRVLMADSRSEELRVRLFERLLYPLLLCFALIAILTGIFTFVVPHFMDMFEDLGVELPLTTKILLSVADFLYGFWMMPPVMLPLGILALAALLILPFPWGRDLEEHIWPLLWLRYRLLRFVPFLGRQHLRAACGRWATTVSLLLDVGCPLPDAVAEASLVESDPCFGWAAQRWAERVSGGERLGDVLAGTRFVPRSFVWQVQAAEGGPSFAAVLREAGEREVDRVRQQVGRLVRAVTPLLVLIIGSVVGLFCIAIFDCLTAITYIALG